MRLGDVVERVRRPIDVEPDATYREIGIRSFGRGIFHKAPVRGIDLGNKRVFAIEPGDIVLNIVFAWEGAVALADEAEAGMCGSHRFPTYRPVDGECDARYLVEYLRSDIGLRMLGDASPGSAGRNRTLNQSALLDTEVLLPAVAQQRRAVDLLTTLDDVQVCYEQLDRASTGAREAFLAEFLNDAEVEFVPLGTRVVVNPRERPLPTDASFVPMDAVHVGARWIARTEARGARGGVRFRPDDVLFARITPCLENGKVAQVQPEIVRGGGSTEFIVLRPAEVDPGFLYFLMCSQDVRTRAAALMTGTTGRQRLSASDLAALHVPIPSIDRQRELAAIAEAFEFVSRSAHQCTQRTRELRRQAANALISGARSLESEETPVPATA